MSSESVCICILFGVRLTQPLNEICVSPPAQTPALLSALLSWSLCKLECVRVGNAAKRRVYCKTNGTPFPETSPLYTISKHRTEVTGRLLPKNAYTISCEAFSLWFQSVWTHQRFKTKNTIKPIRAFLHVSKHSSHSVSKGFVLQQQALPVTLNRQQQRFQQYF